MSPDLDHASATPALSTRRKMLYSLLACAFCIGLLELLCRGLEPVDHRFITPPPKKHGTYRILTLGGSTVHGFPAPELGFVAQLRAMLQEHSDAAFEVINLARPAVDSSYVRAQFEHAFRHDAAADLVIVLTGHNEFLDRSRETASPTQALGNWLRDHLSIARHLERALRRRPDPWTPERILPDAIRPVARGSDWYEATRDRLPANLDAMSVCAARHGVPILFCSAPRNLSRWKPAHQRLEGADNRDVEQLKSVERHIDAGDLQHADAALQQRGTASPNLVAMRAFLEGRIAELRGNLKRAQLGYGAAVEHDPIPWRARRGTNSTIQRIGERAPSRFVDTAAALTAAADHGLIGWDLIVDNCHPTPLGSAILARTLAVQIFSIAAVDTQPPLPQPKRWLDRYRKMLGAESWAVHEAQLYAGAGVYAMKTPYFHYARARQCFDRVLTLDPTNWQATANLATLALLEGDENNGRSLLRQAAQLKGDMLAETDAIHVPYLVVAAQRHGIELSAP